MDASALLDEAGLTEELRTSTIVSESQQERYPGHAHSTGPITSSFADSVASNLRLSGYEASDDDGAGRRVSFLDQNGFRGDSIAEIDEDKLRLIAFGAERRRLSPGQQLSAKVHRRIAPLPLPAVRFPCRARLLMVLP